MGQYLDLQARVHLQLVVGALEGQAGQRIAEHVGEVLAQGGFGVDQQLLATAQLPGTVPRPEVDQLLGQGDRRRITIVGVVEHLVAGALHRGDGLGLRTHQVDTVCWLTSSTWAK
ncbi:hypothetical protein D3C72_1339920 [compost metagenome]